MTAAVIFDLDGTLADTLGDLAAAGNHVRAYYDKPALEPEAYRPMVGQGLDRLLTQALDEPPDTPVPEARQRFLDYYHAHLCDNTRLYPGIAELLDALAERAVPMAVHSNKPDQATRTLVNMLLARWRFGCVLGQRDDLPRKPAAAGALHIAHQLGCAPQRCAYLGDSDVDIQTARAARMRPIGASWGFRGAAELHAAGAEHVIDKPMDLMSLLSLY